MKLKFKRLDLQLAHPWMLARTPATRAISVVALELTDRDGVTGFGEAAPVMRYSESVESVEAFLRDLDVANLNFHDVDASMSYVHSRALKSMPAQCAVNLAILDGAAKHAKKPLSEFLGMKFHEGRHVTSFTIGIDTPDVIARKVTAAATYPVLKIKVGVSDDEANLRALREVAPTVPIRVDANEGWPTKETALERIEWLAGDRSVQFVEQPMPASLPPADWIWLKQRSPLPIFGDESYHVAADAERAAECFHGINVKLVKAGGITGACDALRSARRAGLKTMLGCMIETSILTSAAAHLAELCNYLDLDGNLLVTNDPYAGVTADKGVLSFLDAPERFGLRVKPKSAE